MQNSFLVYITYMHAHKKFNMIMLNVYKMILVCFDGYARAATLFTDSSCSDDRQITDSTYSDY